MKWCFCRMRARRRFFAVSLRKESNIDSVVDRTRVMGSKMRTLFFFSPAFLFILYINPCIPKSKGPAVLKTAGPFKSGYRNSNPRPLAPQTSTLTSCAIARYFLIISYLKKSCKYLETFLAQISFPKKAESVFSNFIGRLRRYTPPHVIS